MASTSIKVNLAGIVGDANVADDEFIVASYAEDASPFEGRKPGIVVRPSSAAEVSAIMALASASKTPVVPVGGRSSICGCTIPRVDGAIMLDMTRISGILEVDADAMTATVGTGITWSRLLHELKERGLRPGFRGPYGGNAGTVGGSLSCNSIGCGASAHGGACDNVLGLEVVLASGETVRTGSGWRDTGGKRFTRYATFNDVTGVFLGDHGTLGIKTAATLKVFPLAKSVTYFDAGFTSIDEGAKAFFELQRDHLAEEIVMLGDVNSIELLASSYRSTFPDVSCIFGIVLEESDEAIAAAKRDACERVVRKHGGRSIGTFLSKAHWLNMFNLTQSLFEEGFWYNTCHIRPIPTLPALARGFHEIARKHDLKGNGINWIFSALGVDHVFSSGWVTLFLKDKTKRPVLDAAWEELKRFEIEATCGIPYWTGPLWEPHALPVAGEGFKKVMVTLKRALDPGNIIHPAGGLP